MVSYDLINTTFEFIYSYATPYPCNAASIVVAFGNANAITSATISGSFSYGQTFDAGAYGYLFDEATKLSSITSLDIGFSSSANPATTTFTSAPNTLVTTASPATASNSNEGNGALELASTVFTSSFVSAAGISFAGPNNTLILDTAVGIANPGLTGFSAAGDQVVFKGITAAAPTIISLVYGGLSSTLTFSNDKTVSSIQLYGLAASTTVSNFKLGSTALVEGGNSSTYSGNLVLSYVPCFLRGTMIDTPFGERAVEDIREGDLVTALVAGRQVPRPVRWVGGSAMDVARHAFRDQAFPVRILRHAFATNRPHRDLLVTPEHCLMTENGLVPARMLVNGSSILIDRDFITYEFFHIELDEHSIILSEALPTESYLDGENRVHLNRSQAGAPPNGLAAPLAVSRALVEPVWQALRDRAERLGLPAPTRQDACMTDDPGLHLLLDDGSEIAACRRDAQRHMFQIPRGTRPTRLRSRASVPSEVVGPFVDDRRLLGVAVDRMVVWTGLEEQEVPPGDAPLGGWHSENSATRWTNGDAELDLPVAGEDCFLDVHVSGTLPYKTV